MARKTLQMHVDDGGRLVILDPGFDTLDLIRSIDPDFEIETAPLPNFTSPRFLQTRGFPAGAEKRCLADLSLDRLWQVHDYAITLMKDCGTVRRGRGEASLLDVKIEIARRILQSCRLCGRQCGVNRLKGERGICGLGPKAVVAEHFVHIGEEPPINPSLDMFLVGCGLRCSYCNRKDLWNPDCPGAPLDADFWKRLDAKGARSMSFVGGNPDESLYAVLRFLRTAPASWQLPIVWNCNGYAMPDTVKLLDGIVDAFVPDLKFGNEKCGQILADAGNYFDTVQQAFYEMSKQDVPILVRIPLLPGHSECCRRFLSDFRSLYSSINRAVPSDPYLNRIPHILFTYVIPATAGIQ